VITEETVRQIIHKYLKGEATERERVLLENWYYQRGIQQPLNEDDLYFLLDHDAIFEEVRRRAGLTGEWEQQRQRKRQWLPYVAAFFIISLSVSWIFYVNRADRPHEIVASQPADVMSGGNRARLTLADGRQINLSETQSGIVVDNERIVYSEGTEKLVGLEVDEAIPLELSVPRGGTYQITLADGTQVWLNAASKLTYPSRFDSKERIVSLEGEAYFAVTKGKLREWPFKVMVEGQTVEVFGTEFNVSAYPEDPARTTLVEGSVAVTNLHSKAVNRISPGQQAVVSGARSEVKAVDVQKYTAWKDGLFYFKHTPFNELIQEIARWYDVEVVYENSIPKETFSGKMRRGLSLMTVLGLLDVSTKTEIRLEGRKLIIG